MTKAPRHLAVPWGAKTINNKIYRMKKFYYLALAALMVLGASCQKQEIGAALGGDTNVSFTVSTGELATKAIADGTNIDVLYWEIYGTDIEKATAPLGEGVVQDTDGNKEFTVNLKLVADQTYNIVFWAQVDGNSHYNVTDLRHVKISSYVDEKANDETRAAFFRVYEFTTENGKKIDETVYLYRPFSQLNIGATTLETSLNNVNNGHVLVESTKVTVTQIASEFNTLEGVGEGTSSAVTFAHAATPNGNDNDNAKQILEVNEIFYHWLGMNYLIVVGDADNVTVDIEVKTKNAETIQHTVDNVPVKENYRTNILGDILTTGAEFTVVVDERFVDPVTGELNPDIVVNYQAPEQNDQNQYVISSAEHLYWLANAVNGTLPNEAAQDFAGKTFVIIDNIDLAGAEWTPIGADGTFRGTLDGQGHTISNLSVKTEGNAAAGLFASSLGVIKNVNLSNVTVEGHYKAGAVVGDALCSKIESCHVDGLQINVTPYNNDDANNVGGIAGYLSAEPEAYVKDCSVKNATIVGYRDVGGIVGATNGPAQVSGNTLEKVTVIADQTPEYYDNTKVANAGAVVGEINTVDAVIDGNNVSDVNVYTKVGSVKKLQVALDNAKAGVNNIVFGQDITGDATVVQKEGVDLVIDGDQKTYEGTIYIHGQARHTGAETLTIQNVAFTSSVVRDFISSNSTASAERYAHNVTVKNCSFTGVPATDVVGMRYRQSYNMSIVNCTAKDMHSVLWSTGVNGITVDGVTAEDCQNGLSFATSHPVVVNNFNAECLDDYGYGIRTDASGAYSLTVTDSKIKAAAPILMRKATAAATLKLDGANVLTTTKDYQLIVTAADYEEGKALTPATGAVTLDGTAGLTAIYK